MKRSILALVLIVSVVLTMPVMAAGTNKDTGFYDIETNQDVTIKAFKGSSEVTVTEKNLDEDADLEKWYANSDRLKITYKDATDGGYYGVILVEGDNIPTSDNDIFYIDQVEAEGATINFDVYPILPKETTPLTLYISSNVEDFDLIDIPLNYLVSDATYTLGDVDNNGKIELEDALLALQIVAELHTPTEEESLAADVDGTGKVTVEDALMILQYVAEIIHSWN